MVSMLRSFTIRALLLLAPLAAACGDDNSTNGPTAPTPVAITEQFGSDDTSEKPPLNPNGGRTHPFIVQQAGTVSARLTALSPDETITVGLSLGTWNGQVCQILLANDAALLNTTVTGTAQQTGQFCVRIYDVGRLTAPTNYSIDVTHF
jgi:hypothetical protein